MQIEGKYLIHSPRERVWEALNDADILRQCIPGCESLTRKSDTELDADVVAKIGPVKAKFKTRVKLENIQAPESYTIAGSSKAGNAGFGRGKADVRLEPAGGATELSYTADFKVGGKLAQVGSRLVAGATRKTADDFFGSLASLLDPKAEKVEDKTSATAEPVNHLTAAPPLPASS
ncbi:MAG: carbon monoxide dehydrogenase subunit G, partial [Pseudomonadota bacterium]